MCSLTFLNAYRRVASNQRPSSFAREIPFFLPTWGSWIAVLWICSCLNSQYLSFQTCKNHNFFVVSNMGSGASQPATSAAPVTRASYPYPVQQPYPSNHPQQHQQPTTCDPYAPPTYQQYMSSDSPPRESSPPPPPSEAGSNHYPPQNTQYYQPPSQWNTAGLSKSSCPYYME